MGVGEGVDPIQPFLKREVVGEPGGVASGVAESHLDLDMAVLDGCGDQAAGLAHDEPGQGASQPAGADLGRGRVGGDGIGAGGRLAVVVDPRNELGDVGTDRRRSAGAADPVLQAATRGTSVDVEGVGEQQAGVVQTFENSDRCGDRSNRDPGVPEADVVEVEERIQEQVAPFDEAVARLDAIPGVGLITAQVIIAEVGVDMTRFPTAGHLASWAKFSPIVSESAGKRKGKNATGHGNRYLARVLGEAAVAAGKTDTFLGERYRRIARRRGKQKAIVAVGRSILIIVWHLLSDPTVDFLDLGPDFYDTRGGTQRAIRNHIHRLEALGYKVTLHPAA